MNNIFFQGLNVPALEHIPHGGLVEEAFGACAYLMKIGLDLGFSGRCAVMKVIRGVETGEQDAVRFEDAAEFGGDLQGDCPCEVVQAEAGKDHRYAVVNKREGLAIVQLNGVSVGRG